jgi:glycogen operon protein
VRRGAPHALGATWNGHGVDFAVYSAHATAIDVCLFDDVRGPETRRVRLPTTTAHVFHGHVEGLAPGQLYGLRASGPFEPAMGHRFDATKLLVDPYARALAGTVDFRGPLETGRDAATGGDSAPFVPKGVVVDPAFDWQDDRPPRTPLADSLIYELHVKGFSVEHPDIDPGLRGSYSALASRAAIAHFQALGVTAVELLPVHASASNRALFRRGLTNYWGYDTLGHFAPDARFSSRGDRGGQLVEFKEMVRELHRHGIEVILDVVYNHTCEGDHTGPTLSLRGLDNASYYRLDPRDPSRYVDLTGCGNTLDTRSPPALRLVMDSLRHWVTDLHVDGFRFDLASALARGSSGFDGLSSFFQVIQQDPVLSSVKLVAEPWDVGAGGYRAGGFPILWSEWNGRFRDGVRRFWRGAERDRREFAYRLTGSSDLYQPSGRRPAASVNFVTCHDGFTLHDLVSYERKHNEANGDENRDGTDDNQSWNGGVEGETADPAIVALRDRQKRNLLATLFLSQGVPMLLAGDERARTQRGNNNAYCQDGPISWIDWRPDAKKDALFRFVQRLSALRRTEPVLRRRRFLRGAPVLAASGRKDIVWLRPDGGEMEGPDWDEASRAFAFALAGDGLPEPAEHGMPIVGNTLLVLVNGERSPVAFRLPGGDWGAAWQCVVDTIQLEPSPDLRSPEPAGAEVVRSALSIAVYRAAPQDQPSRA